MEKRLSMFLSGLFLCVGMAVAQVQVKGTIISADDGEPLPGASIKVLGTKTGTVTDMNGDFVITVPNADTRLEITHMGMLPRVIKARNGMRISLDTDNKLLDEVMVIGYGTTKRSTFTGSAVELKSEEIANHVTSTATNALIGKVAGIQATGVSAGPGSAPTIRIRGFGSFNASDEPLYVIDGVPMVQGLATINPNDIESMSVLKDASATAIYGSRGANGVILITTKKARGKQDAEVTVEAKFGSNSRLVPNYDVITDPGQYYETQFRSLYNWQRISGATADEAYRFANNNIYNGNNGGLGYQVYTVPEGQNLIGTNFRLNPNATLGYSDGQYYYTPDNWYDETYHNSFRQEYNVSVTGGTDRLSYYAGVGYLNDKGFVDNSDYQRYTGRTNVEYKAKKWLTLSTNMAYTHSISESPYYTTTYGSSGNLFYITNNIGPIYPLYVRNADGSKKVENGVQIYDSNQTNFNRPAIVGNAVRDNAYDRARVYGDIFTGMWKATITPIEGLNISAQLAAQDINSRENDLYSRFGSAAAYDGQASAGHSRAFDINQQYMASYNKTFAERHNLGILVGYEQEKRISQSISGSNDHLFNPFVGELNNALAHENENASSYSDHLMRQGIIGRVSYDYGERYFIDADFRRGASSIFAPGHRWGNFGGVGLGWQINKESFMKNVEWVDLLKAKVSFGANGNDGGMGWHAYADTYSPSYNEETGDYSIDLSSKGNEELTWEKKKMWNFGLDFSLFKYRLNGTIEVYTGRTTDLLYTKSLPLSSGINARSYPTNIGTLLNRGVELSLDGDVIRTKNIKWNINLALGHNHNEFLALDPADEKAGGIKYSNSIIRVGGSITEAYMLKYAGTYNGSYTGSDFAINAWDYNFQDGQALYWKDEVEMEPVMVQQVDESGKGMEDAEGNPIMVEKKDSEGRIVYQEKLDKEGNPVKTGRQIVTNTQDDADKYDLGDIQPKVIGGFGTTFEAFGIDISAQFSFQLGGKTYDGAYHQLMHNGRQQGQAMHKDLLDAWSTDNTGSDIPRLSYGDTEATSQTAYDRFLTSSNYLSLNNLSVGYTFPKKWMNKAQIRSLRVYFAGENLFLLTARQGLDPRYTAGVGSYTSGAGLATGQYATMRSVVGGIQVKF